MKRHILTMTNIENSMDGDDTEETHRLLLVQEQEHRTTQRFGNNTFCIHRKQWSICVLISNAENLTYLLSWNNSNDFRCILDNAVSIEALMIVSANGDCKIFWMR